MLMSTVWRVLSLVLVIFMLKCYNTSNMNQPLGHSAASLNAANMNQPAVHSALALSKALAPLPTGNSPNFSDLLDALMKVNITKQRQYFLRQNINLDGMIFEECRFDECALFTDTGNIHLKDCVLGTGTVINFGPNAKKIVQLATLLDAQKISPDLLAKLTKVGSVISVSVL